MRATLSRTMRAMRVVTARYVVGSGVIAAVTAFSLLAACSNSVISRELGARCTADTQCDDRCLTGSGGSAGDWPGGLCSLQCKSDSACPSDAVCASDLGGVCLYTCTIDDDCAFLGTGWACWTDTDEAAPNGSVSVCRGH